MGPLFSIVYLPDLPCYLVVSGEVDVLTAPELHLSLRAAIDAAARTPRAVVTVDLSAVSFIDNCGIRALVAADAYARVQRTGTLFTGVPACVTRLLRITEVSLGNQVA